MKVVVQITREMKELETRITNLKAELLELQASCSHHFVRSELTKTCARCLYTESLYY